MRWRVALCRDPGPDEAGPSYENAVLKVGAALRDRCRSVATLQSTWL